MQPNPDNPQSIKERMVALIQALLLDNNRLETLVRMSKFKSGFQPVILGLVRQLPNLIGPMLASVSDEELTAAIRQVRDEIVPFLLDEKPAAQPALPENENTPQD